MSTKERCELVGKRFLFVPTRRCKLPHLGLGEEDADQDSSITSTSSSGSGSSSSSSSSSRPPISSTRRGEEREEKRLKLSRIADWNWVSGVIRCATHDDENSKELQVQTKNNNPNQY